MADWRLVLRQGLVKISNYEGWDFEWFIGGIRRKDGNMDDLGEELDGEVEEINFGY